jgi:hypothetical protein
MKDETHSFTLFFQFADFPFIIFPNPKSQLSLIFLNFYFSYKFYSFLYSQMSTQTTTKMLICLWKGCEHVVFEEAMAFQEHVIKHVHEQMQPPILGHRKYAGTEQEQQPMAKKAKFDER